MRRAFVRNVDLLHEIAISHETGNVTRRLAEMIMLMANRYGCRANFRYYSYLDIMVSEAIIGMVAAVPKFNIERSSNPFAYLSTVMNNCFLRVLKKEAQQQTIRDDLLEDNRRSPSTTRQIYNEDNRSSEPLLSKKPKKIAAPRRPRKNPHETEKIAI